MDTKPKTVNTLDEKTAETRPQWQPPVIEEHEVRDTENAPAVTPVFDPGFFYS